MYGFINGIDFVNLEAEKYWSFPSSYKGDIKAEVKNMIFSGDYIGSQKIDGHYFRFIKDDDGNMILQSRTKNVDGVYLNKIDWVPQLHDFFNSLPNGTCFLGELYFPNNEGSKKVTTIMGCLMDKARGRQEKGEKLNYYIFDIWAYNGKSYLDVMAKDRAYDLVATIGEFYGGTINTHYVKFATYCDGEELWDMLQEILYNGGEGVVITRKTSTPEPGKRTSRKTLKIKKEIEKEIDCFLTGKYKPSTREYKGKEIENWMYWEDIRTGQKFNAPLYSDYKEGHTIEPITKGWFYGWAGAVEIALIEDEAHGNSIHPIGWISGISDKIKEEIVKSPSNLQTKVVKVTAMEIDDETSSLRHGKIIEWREDKSWRDCSLSQLKEN